MKFNLPSLLTLFALLWVVSCQKDNDQQLPISGLEPTTANLDGEDFTWKAMNLWYFWQAEVDDLADNRFANNDDYTAYLQQNGSPRDLFNGLLFSEDRFSVLFDDYQDLFNATSGISKSSGLTFFIGTFENSSNAFGVVRYIVPNSNASTQDISRGEFFTEVDGVQLTLENFQSLLIDGNDTFTLTMADLVEETNTLVPNGQTVTLTKEENLQEHPILTTNVIDLGGTKVGYLMYNRFDREFDDELNEVFEDFLAAGVTELVLDLRYNGGGDVSSSQVLSSLIKGTDTEDLFIRQRYNPKIQAAFNDTRNFVAETASGMAINTLNLTRVYILTSSRTASASELVINGLAPYIQVVQIGNVTVGKNESSLLLVDDPDNDFIYETGRQSEINSNVSLGTLLLIGRSENAAGFSDYTDGLVPDITLLEDARNLGTLGDPTEPLLAEALNQISPVAKGEVPASRKQTEVTIHADSDIHRRPISLERPQVRYPMR